MSNVEGWILEKVSEVKGYKEKKFEFKATESVLVNGYPQTHMYEIYQLDEEKAWNRLRKKLEESENNS